MNLENEIKKQFQSKLNDFNMPVPADGWTRLEESLNNATVLRKKMVRQRWQYAGSAAAILILIVGSLIYLNRPIEDETLFVSDAIPSTNKIGTVVETKPQIDSQVLETPLLAGSKVAKSVSLQLTDPLEIIANYIQKENQQKADLLSAIDYDFLASYDNYLVEVTDIYDSYNLTEEVFIIDGDKILLYADNEIIDDKEEYILSFNGKGGLTSFNQTVNSPMTLRSAALVEENKFGEASDKSLYQAATSSTNSFEIEHSQPVSFGVTVSKSLFDDLYIETGLIYTYLYSKRKNVSSNSLFERKQQFHYLGIPLIVNYNLFSLRKLNVYASVGGMIEKDIFGRLLQEKSGNQLTGGNEVSEGLGDEHISQRNPQLSVNAGLGLSYPIYQNFKFYGKIGGAYYFDANNQYPTIYTDSKIVMDLNLGIRYEF